MNFLIFASAIARAKIMRIHSHEWKFVTLIFENQLNYVLIRGYKKNKQQTTTDKQFDTGRSRKSKLKDLAIEVDVSLVKPTGAVLHDAKINKRKTRRTSLHEQKTFLQVQT